MVVQEKFIRHIFIILSLTLFVFHSPYSQTHSVSGIVMFKDSGEPVSSGKVKAFIFRDKLIAVDSSVIHQDGSYLLPNIPIDSVDIMAYQDDDIDFIPTFYDTAVYWQNFKTIYPIANTSNANIYVERLVKLPGQFTLSGKICDFDKIPLPNARIYLKSSELFRGTDISMSDGSFMIDSLQAGNYSMIVDIKGYFTRQREIAITGTGGDTIIFDIQLINSFERSYRYVPAGLELKQCFPNPFNPFTVIKFYLPPLPVNKSIVSLSVYNALGQLVKILVNQNLHQGEHEIKFDGRNHPSGIYYYQLKVQNYTITKKMLLIK